MVDKDVISDIRALFGGSVPGEITSHNIKIPAFTEHVLQKAEETAQLTGKRNPVSLVVIKNHHSKLGDALRSVSAAIDEGQQLKAVRIAVAEDLFGNLALWMYAVINFSASKQEKADGEIF